MLPIKLPVCLDSLLRNAFTVLQLDRVTVFARTGWTFGKDVMNDLQHKFHICL